GNIADAAPGPRNALRASPGNERRVSPRHARLKRRRLRPRTLPSLRRSGTFGSVFRRVRTVSDFQVEAEPHGHAAAGHDGPHDASVVRAPAPGNEPAQTRPHRDAKHRKADLPALEAIREEKLTDKIRAG